MRWTTPGAIQQDDAAAVATAWTDGGRVPLFEPAVVPFSACMSPSIRRFAVLATLICLLTSVSALALDRDGDGVEDPLDNCPTLYNPAQNGGLRIKLNGPLVAGGLVADNSISPDGARVVYRADQDTDNVSELYSVLVGGGLSPS